MTKMLAVFDLLRKGKAVANKEAWKNGQISANVIGGLIIAVAQLSGVFGFPFPIPEDIASMVGGGILAVVNFFLTVSTSETVGILPKKD